MSHQCHDEHEGHGGGHNHGGHNHNHDHDHSDDVTPALQHSLYQHVRFDEVEVMNESVRGSGRAVLKKTWDQRLEPEPELVSDVDEQVLINVPFTGSVKLHSILLRSSDTAAAPKTLKVFVNTDGLDFGEAADAKPTQALELARTSEVQELPVRRMLFSRCQRLTLFFEDNFSVDGDGDAGEDETTRFSYLAFKGEWTQLGRAPTNIIYEAAANPSDHRVEGKPLDQVGRGIGF